MIANTSIAERATRGLRLTMTSSTSNKRGGVHARGRTMGTLIRWHAGWRRGMAVGVAGGSMVLRRQTIVRIRYTRIADANFLAPA